MAKRLLPAHLQSPYLKVMLYGQAGSTKTRTAATAALDERLSPVLMLEQGGNPISFRNYEKLPDIVHMDNLADFNPAFEWLKNGQQKSHAFCKDLQLNPPYKTVLVDSVTEVQRYSFNTVVGTGSTGPGTVPASAEIQHFNKVLGQMVNFARLFFSLDMNVIMTSLEREDKDEATGTIMYKPLLWGQSAGEVPGYAYIVARLIHRARLPNQTKMQYEEAYKLKIVEDPLTEKVISVALFVPSGKYVAKDQYGMGIPFMADPTMTKILDAIEAVGGIKRETQASVPTGA